MTHSAVERPLRKLRVALALGCAAGTADGQGVEPAWGQSRCGDRGQDAEAGVLMPSENTELLSLALPRVPEGAAGQGFWAQSKGWGSELSGSPSSSCSETGARVRAGRQEA